MLTRPPTSTLFPYTTLFRSGTFELHLRRDLKLDLPLAETESHVITMAFDPDLDDCVVIALRQMIALICARTGLTREEADRKSTRLNSSHRTISYAVFCLKKK